jgi:hypothetical protein
LLESFRQTPWGERRTGVIRPERHGGGDSLGEWSRIDRIDLDGRFVRVAEHRDAEHAGLLLQKVVLAAPARRGDGVSDEARG